MYFKMNSNLNIVAGSLILIFALYLSYRDLALLKSFFKVDTSTPTIDLFSSEQLKIYNGIERPQLYLSILGHIFDVTKGEKHYGPGKTYNFFIGRDASRAFVTGQFTMSKDNPEDVTGLSNTELLSLDNWLKFYTREYTKIGKLIGRYFDKFGESTQYSKEIGKLMESARHAKSEEDVHKINFPPCNVEWNAIEGTRVWCTKRSGGIERNWIGVPRKFYEPGSSSHRCACIREADTNLPNLEKYESCDPNHSSCFINK